MLNQVSKTAEMETRRFHHQRLTELKLALIKYAEGQLVNANESKGSFHDSVLKMRDFPLPSQANASNALHKPE